MSSTEEQLISFFAYSFLVYPITNYLVSPQRKYNRVYGAIFAILFLGAVSYLHMLYENKESGPNHYQLLQVTRATTTAELKKAYRYLSRELHPDRNKSPTAADDFNKAKKAYDILVNPEYRSLYDRLGENIAQMATQTVIDNKYIITQMLVYYCSNILLAFFMTFSEPSGEALSLCFFAMAEMLFVIEEKSLPDWFLPTTTPHQIITICHRLFPAFMSGSRSILSAFHTDIKDKRVEYFEPLIFQIKNNATRLLQVAYTQMDVIENRVLLDNYISTHNNEKSGIKDTSENTTIVSKILSQGTMAKAEKLSKLKSSSDATSAVEEKKNLIQSIKKLHSQNTKNESFLLFRNFIIYYMIRLMILKFSSMSKEVLESKND